MQVTLEDTNKNAYKSDEVVAFQFGDITYTEPGVYVYTITEKMPTSGNDYLPGLSYSGVVYRVEVVVTDNGEGKLEATTTMKVAENASATDTELVATKTAINVPIPINL